MVDDTEFYTIEVKHYKVNQFLETLVTEKHAQRIDKEHYIALAIVIQMGWGLQ